MFRYMRGSHMWDSLVWQRDYSEEFYGGSGEDRVRLLSVRPSDRTRGTVHKLKRRKSFKVIKHSRFVKRGSGVSTIGNTQTWMGYWPRQPACGDPLLGMEDWTKLIWKVSSSLDHSVAELLFCSIRTFKSPLYCWNTCFADMCLKIIITS